MVVRRKPKRPDQLEVTQETVGPELAFEYLETMVRNRRVSENLVHDLVAAIKGGQWQLTGDTIKFNQAGELVDGQHRLWAIINSGIEVELLVARGVEDGAQTCMDKGKKRSAADDVYLFSSPVNAKLRSTIAGLICNWTRYGLTWYPGGSSGKAPKPTSDDVLATIDKYNEDIARAIEATTGGDLKMFAGPRSLWAFLYVLFYRQDPLRSEKFYDALISGEGLHRGDPRLALRRQSLLLGDRVRAVGGGGGRKLYIMVAEYVFRAWLAWREGQTLNRLQKSKSGKVPDIGRVPGIPRGKMNPHANRGIVISLDAYRRLQGDAE